MMIVYLLIFFAWILFLFIAGHVVVRMLIKVPYTNFYSTVLTNVFTGYTTVIIIHSLFQTGFKTINIVFLLIGILIYIEFRRRRPSQAAVEFKIDSKQIVTILVASTILFLIPWLTIHNGASYLGFYFNEADYILYSRIAKSLLVYGHENGFTVLNSLDPYYTNPEPYHFFDIWGGATISRIFSIGVFPAMMTIVYPTFYLLVFVGYMSLLKANSTWIGLVAFVLLLIGGLVYTFIDHQFFQSHSNLSYTLISPKIYKLSYFYVFLISAFLLYRSGYISMAILVCAGLPIANIITLPTVVPALFVFLAVLFVRKKDQRKEIVLNAGYVFIIVIAIALFYSINQRASAGLAGAEISKPTELIKDMMNSLDLTTRRNIVFGGALSLIIMYLPYLIIIALNRKYISGSLLAIFPLAVIGISLIVWAVLFRELNSGQIFSNISTVILNLTIAILLIEIWNGIQINKPSRSVIIVSSILLLIAVGFQFMKDIAKAKTLRVITHNDEYLKSVEEATPKNALIGSIRSIEEMTSPFTKYNAVYTLGDYLLLQGKDCFAINLADLQTPIDSSSPMAEERSLKAVRDGMFLRYSKLPANAGLDEDQLMERFVKEYKIKFLIISKDAHVPKIFIERAKGILTDPLSGERFVELN